MTQKTISYKIPYNINIKPIRLKHDTTIIFCMHYNPKCPLGLWLNNDKNKPIINKSEIRYDAHRLHTIGYDNNPSWVSNAREICHNICHAQKRNLSQRVLQYR